MRNYLLCMLAALTCFACVDDKESSYVTDLRSSKAAWLKAETEYMAAQTALQVTQEKLIAAQVETEAANKALLDAQKAYQDIQNKLAEDVANVELQQKEAELAKQVQENKEAAARWEMQSLELAKQHEAQMLNLEASLIAAKAALELEKANAELAKNDILLKYIAAYETALTKVQNTQNDINAAYTSLKNATDNREDAITGEKSNLETYEKTLASDQEMLALYTKLQASGADGKADIEAKIKEAEAARDAAKDEIEKKDVVKTKIKDVLISNYAFNLSLSLSQDIPNKKAFYFPISMDDFIDGETYGGLIDTTTILMQGIRTFVEAEDKGLIPYNPSAKLAYFNVGLPWLAYDDVDMSELNKKIARLEEFDINVANRDLGERLADSVKFQDSVNNYTTRRDNASLAYYQAKDEEDIAHRAYIASNSSSDSSIWRAKQKISQNRDSILTVEEANLSTHKTTLETTITAINNLRDDIGNNGSKLAVAKDLKALVEAGEYKKVLDARDSVISSYNDVDKELTNLYTIRDYNDNLISSLKTSLGTHNFDALVELYTEKVASSQKKVDDTKALIAQLESTVSGANSYQIQIDYYTAKIEALKKELTVLQTEANRLKELVANTETVS
ncbi:MAG: hypothetical protein ACK5IQ_08145 [Bacteroidales bacterium]